jgi:hypothetical protein
MIARKLKIKTVTCELSDTNAITGVHTVCKQQFPLNRLQYKLVDVPQKYAGGDDSFTSAGAIAIFMATDKPGKPVMVCTVHI